MPQGPETRHNIATHLVLSGVLALSLGSSAVNALASEHQKSEQVEVTAGSFQAVGSAAMTEVITSATLETMSTLPEVTTTTVRLPKPTTTIKLIEHSTTSISTTTEISPATPTPNEASVNTSRDTKPNTSPKYCPVKPLAKDVPPLNAEKINLLTKSNIDKCDFEYVNFIFTRESGWVASKVSGNGCIGYGQNCRYNGNYWLKQSCPDWDDNTLKGKVCQINRFDLYAQEKNELGSWHDAYVFWVNNGWW